MVLMENLKTNWRGACTQLVFALLLALPAVSAADADDRTNVAESRPYAYYLNEPGQPIFDGDEPYYFRDDMLGDHPVHSRGFGSFGVGDLTDGVILDALSSRPALAIPSPVVVMYDPSPFFNPFGDNEPGPDQAVDIVFDLGQVHVLDEIVIGTFVDHGYNLLAPDDVLVSFSTTGTAPTDFGRPIHFDLLNLYGPTLDQGHHDLTLMLDRGAEARFVRLAFDGGSMQDAWSSTFPNEMFVLDEVSMFASGDQDADGVPNGSDACPDTAEGTLVDDDGCSGTQSVEMAAPCDGEWKNHGEYVATLSRSVKQQQRAGLLDNDKSGAIVAAAARSECGMNGKGNQGGR